MFPATSYLRLSVKWDATRLALYTKGGAAGVLDAMIILQAAVVFALEKQGERIWVELTAESAVMLVAWVVAIQQVAGLVRQPVRREISIPSICFCFRNHGQRKQNYPI